MRLSVVCRSAADVRCHLCESPPVQVGTSDKQMLPINDPDFAVEDTLRQAAKVHLPHLNSFHTGGDECLKTHA